MNKSSGDYLVCRSCHHHYFNNPVTERCPICGHRVRPPKNLWVWMTLVVVIVALTVAGVEMAYGA